MNKEEAGRVIKVLLLCDVRCGYCISEMLCKEFPDYEQIAKNAFNYKFGKELNIKLGKQL